MRNAQFGRVYHVWNTSRPRTYVRRERRDGDVGSVFVLVLRQARGNMQKVVDEW